MKPAAFRSLSIWYYLIIALAVISTFSWLVRASLAINASWTMVGAVLLGPAARCVILAIDGWKAGNRTRSRYAAISLLSMVLLFMIGRLI